MKIESFDIKAVTDCDDVIQSDKDKTANAMLALRVRMRHNNIPYRQMVIIGKDDGYELATRKLAAFVTSMRVACRALEKCGKLDLSDVDDETVRDIWS